MNDQIDWTRPPYGSRVFSLFGCLFDFFITYILFRMYIYLYTHCVLQKPYDQNNNIIIIIMSNYISQFECKPFLVVCL